MGYFDEREADAILERVDGAARLAPMRGIEFRGRSAPRRTVQFFEMGNGQLLLALVRVGRAAGTIGGIRPRIENLCPPQIVFFTGQLAMKSSNILTSNKLINHITPH